MLQQNLIRLTRRTASILLISLFSVFGSIQTAQSASTDSFVIVLDVSNSMWGQVEGRSKIEIAREVIGKLIKDWDPEKPLGLVAYGHRRAGDCSDIETVIPVGKVDPSKFQSIVNRLTPRGKTPLTEAVRKAAAILNYADVPATVILVSDGIESCKADPCKLAAELEKGGIDFTTHVIGFDIKRVADKSQLQCLAEKTGGKFLTAETADQLAGALKEVVKAEPPTTAAITLQAVRKAGGPVISDAGMKWTVVGLTTEEEILRDAAKAQPKLQLKPGKYFAQAQLGAAKGRVEFEVKELVAATHQVILQVPVKLSAPETAEVSEKVGVTWQGPGAASDYLAVAKNADGPGSYISYARLGGGSPTKLAMPKDAGTYEIRYVDGAASRVLATVTIKVIDLSAKLTAPKTAEIGAKIQVGWDGPGAKSDYISIAKPKSAANKYVGYGYIRTGNPVTVVMPGEPETYELRYIATPGHKIAGKVLIEVTDIAATLSAPPVALAGKGIDIAWTGPDRTRDYIAVAKKGAAGNKYISYTYTQAGTPAKVTMPIDPGEYEIRYLLGRSSRILASIPIKIEAAKVTLEAAPNANVGSIIDVTWVGPDNRQDYIAVAKKAMPGNKYIKYTYTQRGSPVRLEMPIESGEYEIRYIARQGNKILARLPISIKAVAISLTAPPTANAGNRIEVTWVGPNNRQDYLAVAVKGAPDGKYINYSYTKGGSPTKLTMPIKPGAYEIRYVARQANKTLASIPVSITAVDVSLSATPTANAGNQIAVTWTGPDNRRDFITVVPKGAPEKKYGKYAYTKAGSPARLLMPIKPGQYEIRYLAGQGYKTLASIPITIAPVKISLSAAPSAAVGSNLSVTWEGPDNKRDYIAVAKQGARDGKYLSYVYTKTGSPANLVLPDIPGAYELRYMSGQGRKKCPASRSPSPM